VRSSGRAASWTRGRPPRRVFAPALLGTLLGLVCLLPSTSAAAQAGPPNDNFASATILSGTTATATGTNIDATKEPGEPNHAGVPGGRSVWWRWTAPAAGAVTIDTCDSDFDTVLAVYTGSSVNALTAVKSNTDECDFTSAVTFTAVTGQVYSIAVDGDDDDGAITLKLQPTLTLTAATITRRGNIDATRLSLDVATGGEDDPAVPRLVFQRGSARLSVDLELDNEIEEDTGTKFRYTFNWQCARRGSWSWTVTVLRNGERVVQQGTFSVPRCEVRAWFVSRSKVAADFARDFGGQVARWLRCSPVGARHGGLAASWRCGLAQPGATCRGSFLFRYSRTFQGDDIVAKTRVPSGTVTCRR
jgi:hypothetical protein